MSLVGRVGRKRPRARLALLLLYAVLLLGAATTVLPFLLMLSTGLKGPTDQNDNLLIPAYLQDADALAAKHLDDRYSGDAREIAATRALGPDGVPADGYRRFLKLLTPDMWRAAYRTAPLQSTGRLQDLYQDWLRLRFPTVEALNIAYGEENTAFQTCVPPAELLERKTWRPPTTRKYQEWIGFKRTLPLEYRLPVFETRLYQEYVRSKYRNTFVDVPAAVAQGGSSFENLKLPNESSSPEALAMAAEFRAKGLPDQYRDITPEGIWLCRDLGDKATPDEFEAATEAGRRRGYGDLPVASYERELAAKGAPQIRAEFAGRNFRYILNYILLHGNALLNTAIFCLLSILAQLTVNPLAAYALSRYPIRQSGKILIFLLATMAFPAEVAMIPSFLLLKDLGLLNTFAALVLPTAASGYMIFLLKGFFDSLPQELFEAGQIDGAPETTMMMRIALPLSRPVLGYLALLAFMGAYGAFLYAFLVAQDQKVWTLMVFIYQLQGSAPKAVMMAALTLAALPTLLVFLLAQRVILKGIVLPGER